jgi:hypothetical protein
VRRSLRRAIRFELDVIAAMVSPLYARIFFSLPASGHAASACLAEADVSASGLCGSLQEARRLG